MYILLTTTDMKAERAVTLRRMIESVHASGMPFHLYVLIQGDAEPPPLPADAPDRTVTFSRTPTRVSLSAARNILFRQARADIEQHREGGIVAFPDDDCWYPDGLLVSLADLFGAGGCDFAFGRVSEDPKGTDLAVTRSPSCSSVVRAANSNALFVSAPLCLAVGGFDERVGLGAPLNGGEDTDFAIRCFLGARQPVFIDSFIVGHRQSGRADVAKYYAGCLFVLSKHKFRRAGLLYEYCRKMFVGAALAALGALPVRKFVYAIKSSVAH